MTIIMMTLSIIVFTTTSLHDKIVCVIRKNELHYQPGQGGRRETESEKQEIIKIFQPPASQPASKAAQCLRWSRARSQQNTADERSQPLGLDTPGFIIFMS